MKLWCIISIISMHEKKSEREEERWEEEKRKEEKLQLSKHIFKEFETSVSPTMTERISCMQISNKAHPILFLFFSMGHFVLVLVSTPPHSSFFSRNQLHRWKISPFASRLLFIQLHPLCKLWKERMWCNRS